MAEFIIILFFSIIGFFYSRRRNILRKEFNSITSKINDVNEAIDVVLKERESYSYYEQLYMKYHYKENILSSIRKRYTKSNVTKTHILFNKMDKLYIQLNKDIRTLDSFIEYQKGFTKVKSGYRNMFNKSLRALVKLSKDHGEKEVDKYLVEFNKEYSAYKEKEISKLNLLIKKCKENHNNFDLIDLQDNFRKAEKLNAELEIKLKEPIRLKEKFEASEQNIEQLEEDISNKKGTLYSKTLSLIKNNSVTKDQTSEWNRIKRRINTFNKNRLLGKNVIKLSKNLNDIINEMMELCDSISKDTVKVTQKVN